MAPSAETIQLQLVGEITRRILSGRTFDEVFEIIYRELRQVIPYNRIGVALLSEDGASLTSVAGKSDGPLSLKPGYTARLDGSTLGPLLKHLRPRIINNLQDYLDRKPDSESTRMIVEEGMLSNLALPLVVDDRPFGVMFFSSRSTETYRPEHEGYLSLIAGHVAIALDRARMREQLVRNERLAAVGELAATVAHEVRNPLAGISSAIQMIADGIPRTDRLQPVITEVQAQIRRLEATVRDLLIFGRPQNPQLQQVDLVDVVEEACRLMRADHGAVRIEFAADGPIAVRVDPHYLQQVLLNLLQNAIHAMPHGGTARVSACRNGAAVEVSVTDEGSGIDPRNLQKIFQPFFSTKARGTGLGLPISRKLVEAHGGTIEIQSTPGAGTTATVRLPQEVVS
jgi:signal transduction histidine kinase